MPINRDRILYEDEWFLAVHKLSGELTVRGKGEMHKLPLLDFLRKNFPGIRPVSRLDFDTSGVILFARNRQALEKVTETKFEEWKKAYRTIVTGRLRDREGDIKKPLPARTKNILIPSTTHYKVLEEFPSCSFVEAVIHTGRHHQIRRHFAGIHHPLALDSLYGDARFNRAFGEKFRYRKFFLHAFSLSFVHPFTGKQVEIISPLPKAFEEILSKLRSA